MLSSTSAKYDSFCSYFQVDEWIGTETHLPPTDWGWTLANNRHVVENKFAHRKVFT